MNTKTLIVIILAVFVMGSLFFMKNDPVPEINIDDRVPTDFAKAGIITFNTPGLTPGVPYLVYEESGAPALTKELMFDPLSICATNTGATPCIAMSATLNLPFGGKRAVVEGIIDGETVLVRKLRRLEEGEPVFTPEIGRVFISWPEAVSLIQNCNVKMIMQTHSLDVTLDLLDGTEVVAVESTIDEVFDVHEGAEGKCGSIPLATE